MEEAVVASPMGSRDSTAVGMMRPGLKTLRILEAVRNTRPWVEVLPFVADMVELE